MNAGFFIEGDDKIVWLQRLPVPDALIEIQDAPGFESELRITRKDPTALLPRTKRIGAEPTPERGPANIGHQPLPDYLAFKISDG